MTASLILLTDTQGKFEFTGEKIRVDGWYGYGGARYTVAIHYHNLKGRVWIEASLAANPSEHDWFPIWLTPQTEYVEYPVDPSKITGSVESNGDTGASVFTFCGNFSWMRARLDRSYIKPTPTNPDLIAEYGVVTHVLLNK